MHKLQSSSVVKLAQLYNTVSTRLKRTVGRPSAPLGSRILNSPDDIFKHNMWWIYCSVFPVIHFVFTVFDFFYLFAFFPLLPFKKEKKTLNTDF